MRFCLMALLTVLACVRADAVVNIPPTSLTYDVNYHLGFINKTAGHAYVNYYTNGNQFVGTIQGHSIPWGGKIYTIHSSLRAAFGPERDGVSPETVEGLQGIYTKPEAGQNPAGVPYRNIYGGGTLNAGSQTMEAVTILSDMLSIYYYAHQLGFGTMEPGRRIEVPVIRDGLEQTLYITYNGTSYYSNNGYNSEAYSITFQYTYEGAPDRYPVNCLIGTDSRIPLMFSADIRIGHVEMLYVP